VSDLFSPLAGEVKEFNETLEDEPEAVNNDPYGAGWIIKLKVTEVADVEGLMTAEAYAELIS
jgi:glycine cleavage system H protein